MTDLMVPSKRPRAPSFSEKHPDHSQGHAVVPEEEMAQAQVQVQNFLELCRFCKKNLGHDDDVFMYGYLGAFCSKVCRQKQMACDVFWQLPLEKAKAKKGRTSSLTKDEALERFTSPRFYI